MASTINASTAPAGLISSADGSGILNLQGAGATQLSIASTGASVVKNPTAPLEIVPKAYVDGTPFVSVAYNGTPQLTSNGVNYAVELNEIVPQTTGFTASVNNTRWTPNVEGIYQVSGAVIVGTFSQGGGCSCYIFKNGALATLGSTAEITSAVTPEQQFGNATSGAVYMNGTTDYLTLVSLANSVTPQTYEVFFAQITAIHIRRSL